MKMNKNTIILKFYEDINSTSLKYHMHLFSRDFAMISIMKK